MRRPLPKPPQRVTAPVHAEARTRVQTHFDAFVEAVKEWKKQQDAAREASNAANRQKTVVNNACKELIREGGFDETVEFHVGEYCFRYATADSEIIRPEDVLSLYEKKQITKEQFLACISVSKTDANKHLGADRVTRLAVPVKGTKVDMRVTDLDTPVTTPRIHVPAPVVVATEPVAVTPQPIPRTPIKRVTALAKKG